MIYALDEDELDFWMYMAAKDLERYEDQADPGFDRGSAGTGEKPWQFLSNTSNQKA